MPWKVTNAMTLKREFAALAVQEEASMAELCRRYGISRPTGYKWVRRFRQGGLEGLAEQSRRPIHSPGQTAAQVEARVVQLREQHPAWGGRKLRRRLQDIGVQGVPAVSTITGILHRHDLIGTQEGAKHKALQRFEHPAPNDLWQMDFKGHIAMEQGRCHPLTVLDDHSRYALGLDACANERAETVREHLSEAFRRYGLPWRMLMDNGSPWGDDGSNPYTAFTVWLLRLGIGVSHGRPYHPQTQGKDERFHRTLAAEVLREPLRDLAHGQQRFDRWRTVYNHERPHEALGMAVPASRYQASPRSFPEVLPPIQYAPGVEVRKVQLGGRLSYRGREYRIPKALYGYPIGLRPTVCDGVLELLFCHHVILHLDLRSGITTKTVNHVPAHL
jgi:transposase InsO family protein